MQLTIRNAPNHPGVESLLRAGVSPSGEANVEEEVAATLAMGRGPGSLTLVASEPGDRYQLLELLVAGLEQGGSVAFVRWLVVTPEHRRKGVATALMDALETTPGIVRVRGMVDRTSPVARRFWRSRGWQPRHPRPRRVLMGVDLAPDREDAAAWAVRSLSGSGGGSATASCASRTGGGGGRRPAGSSSWGRTRATRLAPSATCRPRLRGTTRASASSRA
jgi:GNAT superfamily N-acetyltransferase